MVHTVSAGGSDCRYLGRFGLVISQSRCAKTKRAASRAEAALWNTQVETVAVNASGHTFNFTNRLAGIKICDSTSSPGETNVSLECDGRQGSLARDCFVLGCDGPRAEAGRVSTGTKTERAACSG